MRFIITALLAMISVSVNAECWVVSNLKGQSQFGPEYKTKKDEVIGTYHVSINGNSAILLSVGDTYSSGLIYTPTSETSMIGTSTKGSLIETWAIMPDGRVFYTKTRSTDSHLNQLSSFIGDVIGKC
ncbi:MAG: hypothetical protein RR589_15815 [Hafnia sp.]|uniref:hypothetical protein n=1 Tax=Hafnia TaxID=568 RepID=UPI00103520F2|nr:hypothetical protein [Hafnia paralvei]TBM13416.1 hypothetical protein EYY86_14115 [Hafnia paralvei]